MSEFLASSAKASIGSFTETGSESLKPPQASRIQPHSGFRKAKTSLGNFGISLLHPSCLTSKPHTKRTPASGQRWESPRRRRRSEWPAAPDAPTRTTARAAAAVRRNRLAAVASVGHGGRCGRRGHRMSSHLSWIPPFAGPKILFWR